MLLCAGAATAQDLPREEPDRARRESRAVRRAASDAQRSALLPPLDSAREVRYEELLTDPDDIGLNYLFAQSQIRRGELRGASATLQRILMLRPELLRVRLLYAVVLYRLDNLIEAEREFRAIARLELPVSLGEEVAAYLGEIEIRSQRTRYGLGLTLGSQYDSNRNAAPSSGDVLFLDFRVPLADDSRRRGDFSFLAIADASVEHDLETQAGHQVFATFSSYLQKQIDVTELDLAGFAVGGGLLLRTPLLELRPALRLGLLLMDGDVFLKSLGGGVELRRALTSRFDLHAILNLEQQDYDSTPASPRVDERTGLQWNLLAGFSYRLAESHRLELGAGFVDKQARRDYWAYHGARAVASYTFLLGGGQFLAASTSFERDWYSDADPFVSVEKREDDRRRSRITYGLPLGLLLGGTERQGFFREILATFTCEYFESDSNMTNYSYDNWKASVLFTRRWRF